MNVNWATAFVILVTERSIHRASVLRADYSIRGFLRELWRDADIPKVPDVRQLHTLRLRGCDDNGLRLQPAKVTVQKGLLPLQASDENSRTDVNGERRLLDRRRSAYRFSYSRQGRSVLCTQTKTSIAPLTGPMTKMQTIRVAEKKGKETNTNTKKWLKKHQDIRN